MEPGFIKALEKLQGRVVSVSKPSEKRWFAEILAPGHLDASEALLEKFGARFMTITCADKPAFFELLYHFDVDGNVVTLRTALWKPLAEINSIFGICPAAELAEQEIKELFGINFSGNPRASNLLLMEKSQNDRPLLRRVPASEERIDKNLGNIVEHGSTTAPSRRIAKVRMDIGLAENPPLCQMSDKCFVRGAALTAGANQRHKGLKKPEVEK